MGGTRSRRRRRTARESVAPRLPADPRLLEIDLAGRAGEAVARSGRKYALLGRVERLRLSTDGKLLQADVRGDRPAPYEVAVQVADGTDPESRCTCDDETGRPCRHVVAALEALRFPLPSLAQSSASARRRRYAGRLARGRGRIISHAPVGPGFVVLDGVERTLTREERVDLARQEETRGRRERARRERSEVKRLRGAGRPPRFRVKSGSGAAYTVTLRGTAADLPSCTCPDFEKSELGLCKHTERVRVWFSRRGRRNVPKDVLSVWWRPRVWQRRVPEALRETRLDAPLDDLPRSLRRYFDAEGWLCEPPQGTELAAFAREAIGFAERVARRRGLTWDLDPEVVRRLETTESEVRTRRELGVLDRESSAWREIVPRIGFRLHPYQEDGVLFLARRGRAFLADDMGLGKTLQAIVATLLLRRVAGAARALVVCPASLKHQWRREIHKACGEHAVVVEGRRSLRDEEYRRFKDGFLVLNYELVLRDLESIRAAAPDLVILDEAQRIKNWDTKTAKAVKMLESRFAFVLTGTPLENRLGELHSLVEFLHARVLGPRWRLMPFHAIHDSQGRVLAYEGFDVLRHRLRDMFLRRERAAVLDQLPERIESTFWTDMTAAQRRPYRRQARKVASLISRNQPLRAGEIRALLRALTGMRILCNSLAQYSWEKYDRMVLEERWPTQAEVRSLSSPKLEEFARVLEDLLEESDSRIVVFSQWERTLRVAHFVVRELLDRRGERADVFHGGLSSLARVRLLESFRDDPGFRVMFSTDAGGQGLNLQEAASVVVNLEVPWNPAVLEQRIARVHRLGQRRAVRVLNFITRDAIEERVRQVVESKRALFEGLLVDGADSVVLDAGGRSSLVEKVRELLEGSDSSPELD